MDERTLIEQLDPTRPDRPTDADPTDARRPTDTDPIDTDLPSAGDAMAASGLTALAAGLDVATRVVVRLRRDGLVEVVDSGEIVGFVEHVAPVFVALAGSRPGIAVEVAQRRTLALAVEALRSARADYD